MKIDFSERPDEAALLAARQVAIEVSTKVKLPSANELSLLRAIACNSTYLQVLHGSEQKTFTAFAKTRERSPGVYAKLEELGYVAIKPE